jgi:AP-2 complex subunit mu-1
LVVTRRNANASLLFELLHKLVQVFKAYFSNKFDEDIIRENFSVIYELLDEMLDFGFPQICEADVLKAFITTKGLNVQMKTSEISEVLKSVTGAVSWRKPSGISYRKNEVFLDVIESVNMLMSAKGTILHADVTGKVVMKCYLSGTPECKFGLNDKLMLQTDNTPSAKKHKAIDIDDVTFHQCVRLGKFDNDRSISFIPPDGEFELMKYRVQNAIVPPFRLVSPTVRELGKTRLEVQVTIKSVFNSRLFGKNVTVIIPTPKNTAKCNIRVSKRIFPLFFYQHIPVLIVH